MSNHTTIIGRLTGLRNGLLASQARWQEGIDGYQLEIDQLQVLIDGANAEIAGINAAIQTLEGS